MAKQPLGGRPNKATLARIKLATVVGSIGVFVGSLGGVAYLNPGLGNTTGVYGRTQAVQQSVQSVSSLPSTSSSTSQASNAPLQLPSVQRQASVVPLTRTRGS